MKTQLKLALAASTIAVTTMGLAPAAHAAAPTGPADNGIFSPRGIALAQFWSYGEWFRISDGTCNDHITARLQYKQGSTGQVITSEVTCSNPSNDSASKWVDESFPEGATIYFRACLSGAASGCSDWTHSKA